MEPTKITKVQALAQPMEDTGNKANWTTIYQDIGAYYPGLNLAKGEKLSEIAKAGIRGVLYRDCDQGRNIFTKIGEGIFALKSAQ